MTVHSFAEGAGIGAAFGGGARFGLVIAVAIAIHNIPEGLAISLVLVPHGMKVRAAAGWSIFSSLPQPLVAVPAFAAGAMLALAARDVLPEALDHSRRRAVFATAAAAFGVTLAFQLALLP
jgi:zinc transporter ZupT